MRISTFFASTLPSILGLVLVPLASAESLSDLDVLNRIRHEGFHRSRAMEYLSHLTEDIGPRLTGSPAMRAANEWTRDTLEAMGLENAHLEAYEFGYGWSFDHCTVTQLAPVARPLIAYPRAWTPGTTGPVEGEAVRVEIESAEDLEEYRGELAGKIVFLDDAAEIGRGEDPVLTHLDEEELREVEEFTIPSSGPSPWRQRYRKILALRDAINPFLVEEGALAVVRVSSRGHGIVNVSRGGSQDPDAVRGVCELQMAAEHYNAILRALDADQEVRLQIDVGARFLEDDTRAYDTVAELPGRHRSEVVMIGGHLDSWHAGTGATDNAFGVAAAMEAMRILGSLDAPLRRTVRIALWSGEEQGFLGSRAYVRQHFATRPAVTDSAQLALPEALREPTWPLQLLPEHRDFQAYFNLDNGAGAIRGIYTQENVAAAALFRDWLEPVADLGAHTVTNRNTGGTDHLSFDRVGLPGFQFIQDELDYFSRTHHTQLDVLDYVDEKDLQKSAVILAWFAYRAATLDERFPREPLPTAPAKAAGNSRGKDAEQKS